MSDLHRAIELQASMEAAKTKEERDILKHELSELLLRDILKFQADERIEKVKTDLIVSGDINADKRV